MRRPIRRSVRQKLMQLVLATVLIALLVATAVIVSYDAHQYRRTTIDNLSTQAQILALSSIGALVFDDPATAREDLSTLRVRSNVLAAAIYRSDGSLFASFTREGFSQAPSALPSVSGYRIDGGHIVVVSPVLENKRRLGSIYLRARYELSARLFDYLGILSLVLFVSLAIALLIFSRLQGSFTRPLLTIADVARRVIEQRDYSLRVARSTDDELGLVVDALNDMLEQIEQHAARLEAADRRKDDFLATLAHELRNPLAPIRQAARISQAAAATPEQKRWAHEVIDRQVRHMSLLLDDLLDVSRITRGKLQLRKEWVELSKVVEAALETSRPSMEARNHELVVQLPPEPISLYADPLRLAQILSNLLTNAAKYTDHNGKIRLSANREDGQLLIRVTDSGIGIDAEMFPRLFEMFSQAKSAMERAEGGLGIGLALVKGLVTLHGGTVSAASKGAHLGSEFTVRLPIIERPTNRHSSISAPDHEANPTAAHKIVIADDNRDSADSLAALLRMEGHEVSITYDGEEALAVTEAFKPRFALLDIGMPKLSGYEVAQRLRAMNHGKEITLIALTGWGQEADRARAWAAGFDHHLTKPVDPDRLNAIIRAASN